MEIRETLEVRRPIDIEIARRLNDAIECRAYLNDARFMKWFYEKYGTDQKFEFYVDDDILFVVAMKEGRRVVITCLCAKTHTVALPTLRPKFNGIKKKREQELLKTLDSLPL
jgi:hypothetical protein